MSTQFPEIWTALAAPFVGNQVRTRNQAGRTFSYITARTAMNRLDEVLGPENWSDSFAETKDGLQCTITAKMPDGSYVSKSDGGAAADMPDGDNDQKSAFSDAFKRAAVKFGVARYLYGDGVPEFVRQREPGTSQHPSQPQAPPPQRSPESDVNGRGDPTLPPARRPEPARGQEQPRNGNGNGNGNRNGNDGPPRSGKAMFAWTKEMEQRHEIGLLKYLNSWAKLQDFPGRMVDWDAEQVRLGYAEGVRKIQSVNGYEEALSN